MTLGIRVVFAKKLSTIKSRTISTIVPCNVKFDVNAAKEEKKCCLLNIDY
jgi:hypothetical protein